MKPQTSRRVEVVAEVVAEVEVTEKLQAVNSP
jgi:hypothetical protein